MTDLIATLATHVRDIRQATGLSQEAYAKVLGIHRTYYGGIERGERNLSLRAVMKLADRMGVPPEDLLLP